MGDGHGPWPRPDEQDHPRSEEQRGHREARHAGRRPRGLRARQARRRGAPWNVTESVQPSAASSPTQAKREADARFTRAESAAVVLSADVVGDPTLRARAIVEIRGVPARIAGKYRVRDAKHQITGSGYGVALKLTRDAVGKVPPGAPSKPQGGEHNDAQPKTDGTLDWVQTFDKETGAEILQSRGGIQPLGSGDPEGQR